MQFSLGKCASVLAGAALMVICSCEKHHVGEIPEVQKEHVDPVNGHEENTEKATEMTTTPTPAAQATAPTPTAAEFFPAKQR